MTGLPFDLKGRVAIVTGANHGIGAATAEALAACGARILVTYLRLNDPVDPGVPESYRENRARDARGVVASIRRSGGETVAMEADLADPAVIGQLFDTAEEQLGPVDILVNNATGWLADTFVGDRNDRLGRNLLRASAQTFDQQFAVDARGAALMISEFVRRHEDRKADWGRIVGLTSGGPQGFPGEVSYGAAKAALENYIMSAAFELAPYGITANVVYPPVTDTGWVTEEVLKGVDANPRMFHIVKPEEVAAVIAYLVSDLAWLVTGNVIRLR
ncbi:MAG: SDR family NAD(P)-dependent oxidoreductase [Chloroflexota bacterium]